MASATAPRPPYLTRLWAELGRMGGEHDAFIKVIIVERIVKSTVLFVAAISLIVAGRTGYLDRIADYAENQLNLNVGHSIVITLLFRLVAYIGNFNHVTIIAVAGMLYAALEATEGVGLAMRRRWAEYLTVIATGILIPYEAYEVVSHTTFFKIGALLLNLAVVGYLVYRKRLFFGI